MAKTGANKIATGAVDLFGEAVERDVLLRDIFLEPPFSILDGKTGSWLARKNHWKNLGIQSELGRGAECMTFGLNKGGNEDEMLDAYGRKPMTGTSIFDPALTELMYRWFCPKFGDILDPFAGGSVRGLVAGHLGYGYTGLELRPEQVASNEAQLIQLQPHNEHNVCWITGDSDQTLNGPLPCPEKYYDFIFSCPPYHDLEVYSDDPADLSNMPYDLFLVKYMSIICKAVTKLKDNRFAVFVVGDIRDKNGFYRDFPGATRNCFRKAGAKLYNEAKLLQPLGTAMLRVNSTFGPYKKLIKTHEDVLIFYKGDPKKIKEVFNG